MAKEEYSTLSEIQAAVVSCRKCPRLVAWREKVAREKVLRFREWDYWGKAIPGFGDEFARVLIVGLAPAAHGANRTGRMFTGDRSGDWLYRALHKFGFTNQPNAEHRDDGLRLKDCYITAAVHCAPPQNKPTATEKDACFPYLVEEMRLLSDYRVVIALGSLAFTTALKGLRQAKDVTPTEKPKFGHAHEVDLDAVTLLASYHPSQQNTFTGRLTEPMFDAIFRRARELVES